MLVPRFDAAALCPKSYGQVGQQGCDWTGCAPALCILPSVPWICAATGLVLSSNTAGAQQRIGRAVIVLTALPIVSQAAGEVRVTRKFLENFSGDQVRCGCFVVCSC